MREQVLCHSPHSLARRVIPFVFRKTGEIVNHYHMVLGVMRGYCRKLLQDRRIVRRVGVEEKYGVLIYLIQNKRQAFAGIPFEHLNASVFE